MRGEEVQIFGAIRLTGIASTACSCCPARTQTGHRRRGQGDGSVPARPASSDVACSASSRSWRATIAADAPLDEAMFLQAARAGDGQGLLHNGVRRAGSGVVRAPRRRRSRPAISGLLIGEEPRCQPLEQKVVLIGAPVLDGALHSLWKAAGVSTSTLGAEACVGGSAPMPRWETRRAVFQ